MRAAVLGGTGFIGRAIVAELLRAGHDVLVIHRGLSELPGGGGEPDHAHVDRHDLAGLASSLDGFGPDVLIDGIALTASDADDVLVAVPGALRMIVLSSMDVYRAFGALQANIETDAVPLDESAPVRSERYPYRGNVPQLYDYEKLDVEERYLWRGATILRLPMVYGECDPQRREEPVLRRIRAGRKQLPVGAGNWLWTRAYVGEVARAVRLAAECPRAAGEVINIGEATTATMRAWIERIAEAASSSIELVTVRDDLLPSDLRLSAAVRQHLLVAPTKAQVLLGWTHASPIETVARSVRWHLANPPASEDWDFDADDRALAAAAAVIRN